MISVGEIYLNFYDNYEVGLLKPRGSIDTVL